MAKATPLAIKVAIYHRIIAGDISRVVAKDFRISQPTALKYANEVIEMLRCHASVDSNIELRTFMRKTLKHQPFQYMEDELLQNALAPILDPYLGEADAVAFAEREGADVPMSTRVSPSTHERFQQIARRLAAAGQPDLTASGLLRDVIERFCEQAIVPSPDVSIADASMLQSDLAAAIAQVLVDHGVLAPISPSTDKA